MESHHVESAISTFKVDFMCSKDCSVDMKKKLQQFNGVESISIEPNKGLVTVIGNVNPMILARLLQKMCKKAELWSFEKAPTHMQAKRGLKTNQNTHCIHNQDSVDSDVQDCNHKVYCHGSSCQRAKAKATSGHNKGTNAKKKHICNKGCESRSKNVQPPPQIPYYGPPAEQPPPPPPYYQPMTTYMRPPSMYGRLAPPLPYGYGGYYNQMPPHAVAGSYRSGDNRSSLLANFNPMIHYNSYADNYRYTF
ncbi:Heavy metal transport/detoxification superfamily protein [Quillaja saponaria]|uniref:Heavy metal transport/detoxification superfamily protein n=1 Tax=Quillaja saponaria TaxID=32244 RepID=A0AAD7LY30_QUISA|nr:Heavy metal transport/detoxification superfamily protein [Quillaja saponaria]